MTDIKTATGFEISLNESSVDDMELLELVSRVNDGEVTAYPKLARRLLGEEGLKKLYDHIRTEDGRVPIEAFSQELTEILTSLNSKKK